MNNYFGGARSKGFATECFKVASEWPEVALELVQDIFEFTDLFFQGKEIIIFTSAERKVKDSRHSGMFQSCIRMLKKRRKVRLFV